jgi:hypothetical protein
MIRVHRIVDRAALGNPASNQGLPDIDGSGQPVEEGWVGIDAVNE